MAPFDVANAEFVRRQMAPNWSNRRAALHQRRVRRRAALGVIGTVLVLMGVAMGVLTIRFILVVAHTVLQ
jgi:hypothetical protein